MRDLRKKSTIKQAFILCGGLGSRLGKITKKTPKPLILFNKKPFIEYLINQLARHNIKEIFLLCGYKKELFFQKYHNKLVLNSKVTCIAETKPLGSAGAIYKVRNYLDKNFFLLNGDTFYEINFNDFAKKYLSSKKLLGIVTLKKKGSRFLNIHKKKGKYIFEKNKNNIINSGILCLNKKIIKTLNNKSFSLEEEIFKKLAIKNQIYTYDESIKNTKFFDIGTPDSLVKAKIEIPKLEKKKTIFLDRDGVINEDLGYVVRKNKFKWIKNIQKLIKYFNNNNYYTIVVTNQSGIGRGFYSEKDVKHLHKWANFQLNLYGAHIDDFYYAPYFSKSKNLKYRKNFFLRKPKIGMIIEAAKKWNIDLKKSIVIGDQLSDIEMAKKLKLKYFLVDKKTNYIKFIKDQI